jgi:hypothetical protein
MNCSSLELDEFIETDNSTGALTGRNFDIKESQVTGNKNPKIVYNEIYAQGVQRMSINYLTSFGCGHIFTSNAVNCFRTFGVLLGQLILCLVTSVFCF